MRPKTLNAFAESLGLFVDRKHVKLQNGDTTDVQLFAKGGAIGVGEITETGDVQFMELERTRSYRRGSKGRFRFYNEYRLPENFGVGTVTVRLHGDKEDTKRRFNRAENVRVIPPTDPDFKALYHRRNDAESINRGLVDTLYLGRAHSVGHARQLVNLLGYALTVNALALHQHRRRRGVLTQAA